MTVAAVAFVAFLLAFTAIGIASSSQSAGGTEDYLVAGRSVPAWLTALSSVATNNSGFMFVGLIGFTYTDGLSSVWMAVAWIAGDWLAWQFVHPQVRARSEEVGAVSVPALLGAGPTARQRAIVVVAGVLTFLFLGGYAAAQLQAGSLALESLFGWPDWAGAVIGAVVVVAYCFSGGLRASIWTDAAQAVVMLGAMVLLLAFAVAAVGGPGALAANLADQDPQLVSWTPPSLAAGLPLYVLGFVAGGFGAVGQPHILIRTMALDDSRSIRRTRRLYFAWFIPFYIAAVAVALYARAILQELAAAGGSAAEGALPELAIALMPQVLVGMTLAGLFSATLSTADSQVLACSAAVTQDVWPRWAASTVAAKGATLAVTALALVIALRADDGVFALVLGAWSLLASSFGPLLVLRVWRRRLPTPLALAMIASGFATAWVWAGSGLAGAIYAPLPGMLVPTVLWVGWAALGGGFGPEVETEGAAATT